MMGKEDDPASCWVPVYFQLLNFHRVTKKNPLTSLYCILQKDFYENDVSEDSASAQHSGILWCKWLDMVSQCFTYTVYSSVA